MRYFGGGYWSTVTLICGEMIPDSYDVGISC